MKSTLQTARSRVEAPESQRRQLVPNEEQQQDGRMGGQLIGSIIHPHEHSLTRSAKRDLVRHTTDFPALVRHSE
jgi:hypothetical protein